jgi:RimJ/RimL family protein N-acetyltransferase
MLKYKPVLPSIENRRIRLRLLGVDDLEMTRNWRNQDPIRKWFIHSDIITPEQHRQWFEAYLVRDNDFVFVIEERIALRKPVGQISLYNIEWPQRRAEFGRLMIGDLEAQGKGIAKDAMILLLEFVERAWTIDEVYLDVYADNYPALSIYKSLGFMPVMEVDGMIHMSRKRSQSALISGESSERERFL